MDAVDALYPPQCSNFRSRKNRKWIILINDAIQKYLIPILNHVQHTPTELNEFGINISKYNNSLLLCHAGTPDCTMVCTMALKLYTIKPLNCYYLPM